MFTKVLRFRWHLGSVFVSGVHGTLFGDKVNETKRFHSPLVSEHDVGILTRVSPKLRWFVGAVVPRRDGPTLSSFGSKEEKFLSRTMKRGQKLEGKRRYMR